jgi:hypothetical protein
VNAAETFTEAKANCMEWVTDRDPFGDKSLPNVARNISISYDRQVKFLGPRQIAVQSSGSTVSSPLFPSDIEVVCATDTGDEVSVTTTDFVTQIWDSGLQNKIGPPLDEKHLFKANDAADYTRWVKLHPSGRYALSVSTFWNPPTWAEAWLSLWDRQTGLPLMDRQNFSGPVRPEGTDFELDRSQTIIRFSPKMSDEKVRPSWHLQIVPSRPSYVWLADLAEALGGIALNSRNMPEPVANRSSKLEAGMNALVTFRAKAAAEAEARAKAQQAEKE